MSLSEWAARFDKRILEPLLDKKVLVSFGI